MVQCSLVMQGGSSELGHHRVNKNHKGDNSPSIVCCVVNIGYMVGVRRFQYAQFYPGEEKREGKQRGGEEKGEEDGREFPSAHLLLKYLNSQGWVGAQFRSLM